MESQRYARRLPMERPHRAATDVQPPPPHSASTQVNSPSGRSVQLHIMLHVYCRLHTPGGETTTTTTTRYCCGTLQAFLKKSRQYSEESKNKATKSAHSSLGSPRNRSTHFHKSSATRPVSAQRPPTGHGNVTRRRRAERPFEASDRIGALQLSERERERERARCARIEGAFMCRQTLPSFHCYLPAQTRTHARWAGRHQWECGGAGRRHGGHMWSRAVQGKGASSLKKKKKKKRHDESKNTHSAVFQPSVTSGVQK